MSVVIESATSGPRDRLESRLNAPLAAKRARENQDTKPANDADYELRANRQRMLHSRYSHYDPLQVAIEDGLDGWARQAMASNGFGDLP